MKKSLIIIFALVFVGLMVSTNFISIPDSKAVSYYNWIKGSDMETTTNFVEDSSFESGAFNKGVLYGNWSGTGIFSPDYALSGVTSMKLGSGFSSAWYNLTEPVLGADISSLTFNVYCAQTYLNNLKIYYSDGTYDAVNYGGTASTWTFKDYSDSINENKYVVALLFTYVNYLHYIDDVFMGVPDQYSQEQYNIDTYPWRATGLLGYWQSIGYTDFPTLLPFLNFRMYPTGSWVDADMIGHNLVWGRNSNGSGYIGYDESEAQFVQDINYLDSDSVHFIDLWAYAQGTANIGVKINIIYSDRTFDTKTVNITSTTTWEHLNFGGSWIDNNKYIVQIQIQLANYYPAYVNIDDVGIWSSLPSNSQRFTYTVSPSPIAQSFISFDVYQGQTYTFTGYLWDINGENTENGTVTATHSQGLTTATLSMGVFTFIINPRIGTSDFTEQLGISVNTGEVVEYYELTVNWRYVSGGGGGGGGNEEKANNLTDWLVMFMVIFLPALLFAGGLYENNQQPDSMHISPVFGIIAGLCLSVGLGVYTALVPIWMLILMLIAVALLIVGLVRH
jgi:hypothetical protein